MTERNESNDNRKREFTLLMVFMTMIIIWYKKYDESHHPFIFLLVSVINNVVNNMQHVFF